jgi:hypothetical protein
MINAQLKKGVIFLFMGIWVYYLLDMISGTYSYVIADLIAPQGTINFLSFSQLVSWWPLAANGIMIEDLCLQDASLLCNDYGIYPLITIWIHSILVNFIGIQGTWYFGAVLLPVVAFLLLSVIYSRYISTLWTFALSSLSILPVSGYPFRQFIMDLAMGSGWSDIGARVPPDVTGFPNPSLPLVFFLGLFLLSTWNRHLSFFRIMILTVAWSLMTQVHLLFATIGIVFWFSYLALSLYRQSRGINNMVLKIYICAIIVSLFVCSPSIFGYIQFFSDPDAISFAGQLISFSEWGGILLYVLIPISILALLYRIDRIDPFEIIVKFLPIWAIMMTELSLFLIYYIFEIGFSPMLIQSRIGMFFLHMLYFVPSIYYLSRKERGFSIGTEASGKSRMLRNKLHWLFSDASYVYIPIFLLMLSLYTFTSFNKISENQFNREVESEILLEQISILRDGADSKNMLVSDNPSVNLAVSSTEHFDSLWVNRFVRKIPSDEAIDRLSVFAHIVGWDEEKFMFFMLPSEKTFTLPNNLLDFSTNADMQGLGYWLVFHGFKHKTHEEIDRLKEAVSSSYVNIDLYHDIDRFKITRVFLENINNKELFKMAKVTKYDNGYLLDFTEK